ncbi:uncharacterized protein LOC118446924 [Vespa mandarinia]|uniref:uncharacterized protein LOC118446924 n=1 Tax=Vespa mandarinia TaxID=7446 RepID=UPI001606F4DC|nr:uncharacterized protein LOC118446924 [Vespa mandarinia]
MTDGILITSFVYGTTQRGVVLLAAGWSSWVHRSYAELFDAGTALRRYRRAGENRRVFPVGSLSPSYKRRFGERASPNLWPRDKGKRNTLEEVKGMRRREKDKNFRESCVRRLTIQRSATIFHLARVLPACLVFHHRRDAGIKEVKVEKRMRTMTTRTSGHSIRIASTCWPRLISRNECHFLKLLAVLIIGNDTIAIAAATAATGTITPLQRQPVIRTRTVRRDRFSDVLPPLRRFRERRLGTVAASFDYGSRLDRTSSR